MKKNYTFLLLFLFMTTIMISQNPTVSIDATILQRALEKETEKGYTHNDITNWKVQSDASSLNKSTWYYYIVQTHNGVEVRNAIANMHVTNNLAQLNNMRFVKNIEAKANSNTPVLSANDAVIKAYKHLNIKFDEALKIVSSAEKKVVFSKTSNTASDIEVRLVYEIKSEKEVNLAWNVNLDLKERNNWWNIRIDAATGEFISKNNWVVSCYFGETAKQHKNHVDKEDVEIDFFAQDVKKQGDISTSIMIPSYRALPYYVESPNHGDFELIVNPANPTASPNGWHNDGTSYTATQGNNIIAYDDSSGSNNGPTTNQSSSGLVFDYPYGGPGVAANTYIDAAVTNLFYMTNSVHDIYYLYGFDEASGNFQENNLGNGGSDGDPVLAEAQDGSSMNNAVFSTPIDGTSGRMQMFLWNLGAYNPDAVSLLVVNNTFLAGDYQALDNNFDAPGHVVPNGSITSDLVLVSDLVPPTSDACNDVTNGVALNGKIAVIRRGSCSFVSKVVKAQDEGALAVLIVNNEAGDISMGGTTADGVVTIPAYSINQSDGEAIISQMAIETVNATFNEPTPAPFFLNTDGDFDNGIIAHEFGHGINIRLIGGRINSSCVNAVESMGEGWADFIGKILLLKNIDNGINLSGVGTFVAGQSPNSQGIRPAPYSGDISNNPMTYQTLRADTSNATYTIPHGVGSVWAGMLWDLTWDLIAIHGFNPDIYDVNGTEGNIVALKLVVEAMKLTACDPGFVDGRDAILQADDVLFGNGVAGSGTGANQCAIWGAFARRGLGLNANQGTTGSTSDGMHDYTNPAACAPDYLLTIGGPTEVCEGTNVAFDLVFNAQNGWNTATGFVASGQPGGTVVNFSPATISDTGLVTMNVSNLSPGAHTITVTPGGDTSKNLTVDIVVNETNPVIGDGDTQYAENSGVYTPFANGSTINVGPGIDLDLNMPTTFAGGLVWTAPNGTTYTTDTVSFSSIVDADTAVEGAWTVVANFDNECATSSETVNFSVNINPALSVAENVFENLSVYPNPTTGKLLISSSNNLSKAKVSVIDISGRVLYSSLKTSYHSENKITVNLGQLASGVYFVAIEDDNHKSTKKIIKE